MIKPGVYSVKTVIHRVKIQYIHCNQCLFFCYLENSRLPLESLEERFQNKLPEIETGNHSALMEFLSNRKAKN